MADSLSPMEMLCSRSVLRIRGYLRKTGWSKSKIAKKAGVGEATVFRIFLDDWNPTLSTLRALEAIIPNSWESHDSRNWRINNMPTQDVVCDDAEDEEQTYND